MVNALKDELPKAYISTSHFNLYLGSIFQIEEYVKRVLFKLKNKGKVKKPLSYINMVKRALIFEAETKNLITSVYGVKTRLDKVDDRLNKSCDKYIFFFANKV